MTSRSPAQCFGCSRLDRSRLTSPTMPGEEPTVIVQKCLAFPQGIPVDIRLGGWDHRIPFSGDRGIRYQQLPGEHAQQAFSNWQSQFGRLPADNQV